MGAGENCRFIIENTDILKKCKVAIYDSDEMLWGKRIYHSTIKSPLMMRSNNLSFVILASIDYQDDMAVYLSRLDIDKSLLRYI